MGDTTNNQDEVIKQETVPQKSSSKDLQPTAPPETIIASDKTPSSSQEKIEKIHDGSFTDSFHKVDTVYDTLEQPVKSEEKLRHRTETKKPEDERKPLIDSLIPERQDALEPPKDRFVSKSSPVTPTVEKKTRVGSAASGLMAGERINRNESDIFSLKEETSIASSIFSVNGSPSRKVFRRKELTASNVFPFGQKEEPPSDKSSVPIEKVQDVNDSYNELKRPSSSVRNPLTGTGLSSNDEYKFKGNKRKDGNPLLGLGYTPEATPSTHRIPPGGYSHKLW